MLKKRNHLKVPFMLYIATWCSETLPHSFSLVFSSHFMRLLPSSIYWHFQFQPLHASFSHLFILACWPFLTGVWLWWWWWWRRRIMFGMPVTHRSSNHPLVLLGKQQRQTFPSFISLSSVLLSIIVFSWLLS